jgi:hypothetical protein
MRSGHLICILISWKTAKRGIQEAGGVGDLSIGSEFPAPHLVTNLAAGLSAVAWTLGPSTLPPQAFLRNEAIYAGCDLLLPQSSFDPNLTLLRIPQQQGTTDFSSAPLRPGGCNRTRKSVSILTAGRRRCWRGVSAQASRYFSKSSKTIDGLRVAIHLSIYFRQSRSAGPGSPNPRIFF